MTTTYSIAVRALCEFAARRGDLDLRFTPSPSAQEGIAGHRTVAGRRRAGYETEVSLSGTYQSLTVRGRADGYDAEGGVLEEIKTFRGDLARMPANHRALHWAQARVYGWLLCERDGLASIAIALVYFDVDRGAEAPALVERWDATALRVEFETLCAAFIGWADQERAHRARRDASCDTLQFAHEAFRPGQRDLAKAVYRAAQTRRCLLAEAPTGIGKTIATLFPLLKAAGPQALDRVFFLTAKGSGRALAFDALDRLHAANPQWTLRTVELVAREKACEHPDRRCDGASCPLARGFYDKLPAARRAAIDVPTLTRDALRRVALAHDLCPYWLGQEMARWSDVVVGDYNHYFDASGVLFGLAAEREWRTAVLVDEAHNLVERARAMFSAELRTGALAAARRSANALADKGPRRAIVRLARAWKQLVDAQTDAYVVLATPPRPWVDALHAVATALGDASVADPAAVGFDEALLQFHFDVLRFARMFETFDTHSLFTITIDPPTDRSREGASTLAIRNVVPAPFLAPRFAATQTTVLFSATLTPHAFYADTLGLPDNVARIDVPSPFAAEQLSVRIVREVSTRQAHRGRSLAPIAQVIASQYRERPGNYLAFFASFDYLEQVAGTFAARHPDIAQWRQSRGMRDPERVAFLDRFESDGCGVGFAVLGGAFAEGIDLPGTRLVGAFIATLGLPPWDDYHEALRRRHEDFFGAGYEYTYLFPGLRKVTQAAGRVIRSLDDRGSVHLIDDRYARREVLDLLPPWWKIAEREAMR